MNSSKKVKIAIYIRVSTDEQGEKFGLDTQIRKIEDFIKFHSDDGWIYDRSLIYEDKGYSGTLPPEGRPALKKLMQDAKKGLFDLVVVYKLDRFFRSMRYLLETIESLQEMEIGFYSVSEKFDTSPMGKLLMNIFGTLAQFERDLIIERTSEGKISAARAGRYVGGAVPFGYKVESTKGLKGTKGTRIIIPDKEDSKIVKDIFYWFVDLDYSPLEIARALSKRGVLTNRDKEYKGKYRRANPVGKWSETTIRNKLGDTHYIGKYYYNRRDGSGKEKPESDWIEMECPRIINDETFNKAKRKLEAMKRGRNNKKYDYMFSGKIVCGLCQSSFTGYMSSKKTKNYRCLKTNKSKVVKTCRASHISEKILEETIFPVIENLLKHPKAALEYMQKKLNQSAEYNFYKGQRVSLKKQMDKVEASKAILIDIRMGNQITKEDFNGRLKELDRQYLGLKEELESVESMLTSEQLKKEKIESIKEVLKKYKDKLNEKTSYSDKCSIVKDVVKRIVINGDDVKLELFIPRKIQEEVSQRGGSLPGELTKTPQKNLFGKVKLKNLCGGTGGTRTHEWRFCKPQR